MCGHDRRSYAVDGPDDDSGQLPRVARGFVNRVLPRRVLVRSDVCFALYSLSNDAACTHIDLPPAFIRRATVTAKFMVVSGGATTSAPSLSARRATVPGVGAPPRVFQASTVISPSGCPVAACDEPAEPTTDGVTPRMPMMTAFAAANTSSRAARAEPNWRKRRTPNAAAPTRTATITAHSAASPRRATTWAMTAVCSSPNSRGQTKTTRAIAVPAVTARATTRRTTRPP